MNRIAGVFIASMIVSLTATVCFSAPAIAQDAKKSVVAKSTNKSQPLNEALQRIDRLEAQITEMQSMIGALQTLVQNQGGRLPQRVVQPVLPDRPVTPVVPQERIQERRQGQERRLDERGGDTDFQTEGWGADTQSSLEEAVPPVSELDRNGVIGGVPGADLSLGGTPPRSQVKVNGKSPRSLYDAGYNYMMSSDYTSAEATFKAFLTNYPEDELSGNAQYWLGESYFVRGDFRSAANEFLKGYKGYRKSQKAPDNLLKLGMSLHRLGQADAACQTFNELKTKYKSLPGHISRKIGLEMNKAGC